MSIYRPANSPYFHFDFQFRGERFTGTTKCRSKTAARRFEDQEKHRIATGERSRPALTLDEGFGLWWAEKGAFHKSADSAKRQMKRLLAELGKSSLMANIGEREFQAFIARRRGNTARNKKSLVSNATVNREIELARRVWRYVGKHHDVSEIEWGALLLTEPKVRVRELAEDEEDRLFAALPSDLAAVAEFAMLSGQRRTAVITLLWSKVDLSAGRAAVRMKTESGADGWHSFPLTPRMAAIIANRPRVCAQVFTYECERAAPPRGDRPRRVKGERYPFSPNGWRRKWKRALEQAEIEDFRFHDLRHTAGSRVTRSSNLVVAQKLLGHTRIETTARYAHAHEEDVRTALLKAQSRKIPEISDAERKKA